MVHACYMVDDARIELAAALVQVRPAALAFSPDVKRVIETLTSALQRRCSIRLSYFTVLTSRWDLNPRMSGLQSPVFPDFTTGCSVLKAGDLGLQLFTGWGGSTRHIMCFGYFASSGVPNKWEPVQMFPLSFPLGNPRLENRW